VTIFVGLHRHTAYLYRQRNARGIFTQLIRQRRRSPCLPSRNFGCCRRRRPVCSDVFCSTTPHRRRRGYFRRHRKTARKTET